MARKAGRGSEEAAAVIGGEGPEAPPGLGGRGRLEGHLGGRMRSEGWSPWALGEGTAPPIWAGLPLARVGEGGAGAPGMRRSVPACARLTPLDCWWWLDFLW